MKNDQLTDEERNACNVRCLVPKCRYPILSSHQKRNKHVVRAHLKSEQMFKCVLCGRVVAGEDSITRHMKAHAEQAAAEAAARVE